MQSKQTEAMNMYMRRMHRVIMILAPFFCVTAGMLFTSYKLQGFYPEVPVIPLIVFDVTCILYFIIGVALCLGCVDENNQLKTSYFRLGKCFVFVSLVIQWNFISYLFPVAEFWVFLPFFLIAGVAYLDPKYVTGFSLALLASMFISWAIRPELFLPASTAYFIPDLILRCWGLCFVVLALCVITYIVRRICVTEVTSKLVHEAEKESLIDPMTRLNNRKAYYRTSEEVENPSRLGVVFADINGLKYTNDNFGHVAGDERIINFAQLLSESFRAGEVFRISGDEFVVLCQNIDEEVFEQRVDKLRGLLSVQGEPIATIGCAYGQASLDDATSLAEKLMYEQKAEYYKKFPDRKR